MKAGQKPIKKWSNKTLFRVLLNRLWIFYDHGGVSVGRSYRADLIEGFMQLFPRGNLHHGCSVDPVDEAYRRIVRRALSTRGPNKRERKQLVRDEQLVLNFTGLDVLSNAEFALLSLIELSSYYYSYENTPGRDKADFFNAEEKIFVLYLLALCEMSYPNISRRRLDTVQFDQTSIVGEGRRRTTLLSKDEMRLNFFAKHGISPWT